MSEYRHEMVHVQHVTCHLCYVSDIFNMKLQSCIQMQEEYLMISKLLNLELAIIKKGFLTLKDSFIFQIKQIFPNLSHSSFPTWYMTLSLYFNQLGWLMYVLLCASLGLNLYVLSDVKKCPTWASLP